MEVEDVEAHELDQGDAGGERESDGPAIGGVELLFQVHLRHLAGQFGFEALARFLPDRQLLLVGRTAFGAGSEGEDDGGGGAGSSFAFTGVEAGGSRSGPRAAS